jgi:hypothetical protein
MSGGGKSQTSTQQVQIPPEVMARYNAVNTRAEATASKPFQQYSQDPNAFVAPLTATQQAGIQNVNQAAGMSQPYFNTAAGLTMGGAQGVGPLTQQQIGYYQNPFTQSVVNSTMAGLQQQQGQAQSQQQAEAIKGGAFGGDRAGIQRAQLMGQQGLATAQAISPLYQRGYEQALQAAQGQQGVRAQDLQRQLAAGQQLGGLGTAAQQAAISGGQAQIGAGTAEQQTQQAGLQALYNQFLQERGYDFQTAQFLANIAMGTGALSGSTTTTTQPAPFFSDEREKTNVQPLGEGMYAYDYIDDVRRAEDEGRPMPPKRVGPMAQDIEERAPGLVGEVGGHKVVDASGGLGRMGYQSMGGMVSGPGAYATGGNVVGSEDMRAILAAIGQPLEFYGGKGLYGGAAKGGAGSPGYVPQGQIATPKLVTAGGLPQQQPSGLSQAAKTGSDIAGLLKTGKEGLVGSPATSQSAKTSGPLGSGGKWGEGGWFSGLGGGRPGPSTAEPPAPRGADKVAEILSQPDYPNEFLTRAMTARGGFMRPHYELGGSLPYGTEDQSEDPLADVVKEGSSQKHQLATPGKPPAPTPGLGSDLMGAASLAKSAQGLSGMLPAGLTEGIGAAASGLGSSLAGAGSAAASGLGSLAAGGAELLAFLPLMFSDERMKDNVEPVGELYDGQPIYRYNMKGSPQTQLGLMAQDVERNGHSDAVAGLGGVKMVDYKRATDVAAGLAGRNHTYRGGYQAGGPAEEDLHMLLAALQERAPGVVPEVMSDADPLPLIRSRSPDREREPGLVLAQGRTEPGTGPVRSDEGAAGGIDFRGLNPPLPPIDERKLEGPALRQLVREYGRELKGRRPGFDPEFAERVFQGESGFDPRAVGDDKSSFGVPQLHMGNISRQFPNPGLGDEFKRETGLDPRDPKNSRAMTAWAMDYAADKGWSPWTVARNLKAQGAAGGSGAPASGVAGGERPERVTPGLAGPGRGPMDPASAPFYTLTRAARGKEGKESPVGEALMSENLWIPALAGIGSMLASKSPYLAGAVGEGLQGGTSAYTALQKQQQEMGESRGRTEAQMSDIAQKAFFEYAGRGMVRYQKPDGSYGVMQFADYFALPRDKRPPVDPRFKEYLDTIEPAVSGGRPAGTAGTPAAPAGATPAIAPPAIAPPASGAPQGRPSGVPTTVDLSPEDTNEAVRVARQVALESRATLDERRKNDFFQPQRAAATTSQGVMQLTLPMAATILSLPRGQSLGTSGPFTQAISPYIAALNNLAEVATGRQGAVIDPEILASRESVDKEINRLRSQTTSEAGQRALASLEEMAKGIVSLRNAPEGQRKILAKVLTDTQRNIDKDRWFSAWIERGSTAPGGEPGTYSDFARLTGQEANQRFDQLYNEAFFKPERDNLEKMMSTPLQGTRTTGGQPMSTFEYVAKNAAQLPTEQIVQLADRFGDNTLRYFGIMPDKVRQAREAARGRQ